MLSPISSSRSPTPPPAYVPRSVKAPLLSSPSPVTHEETLERLAACELMYARAFRAVGRWITDSFMYLLRKVGVKE